MESKSGPYVVPTFRVESFQWFAGRSVTGSGVVASDALALMKGEFLGDPARPSEIWAFFNEFPRPMPGKADNDIYLTTTDLPIWIHLLENLPVDIFLEMGGGDDIRTVTVGPPESPNRLIVGRDKRVVADVEP